MSYSTCVFTVVVCGLTVMSAPSAQHRPAFAETMLPLLVRPRLGTTVSAWTARTPTAVWQRYRGTREEITDSAPGARGVMPGGFWCAVATDHNQGVERVAVFFALRDTAPPACRLELLQGVARLSDPEQAAMLFRELATAVSRTLHAEARAVALDARETPVPYGGGTGFPDGVQRWEERVQWPDRDRDVYMFRAASAVGFSVRSSLLTRTSEDAGAPTDVSMEAEQRLSTALRGRHPDAAMAMGYALVPEHQEEIRRALMQAFDASTAGTDEERALLTFAADRIARKVWIDTPGLSDQPQIAPFLQRSLRFVREPHSGLWIYDGALVNVVLQRWPDTEWGQLAFVTRLYEGWTEGCNSDAFVHVIRHGNAWLSSHASSPWRPAVMTAVARAYETLWALSGTFTTNARENARRLTADQAAARIRAIELYEAVIRLAPRSQDAAYARRRIVQVRAHMTTSQDAYSCIIP